MKKNFGITIVILGLMLTGSAAQGETCTFDNIAGSLWTTDANWPDCGHEPTAADLAVIPAGETCNMDDATGEADSLTVESTATLNIQASKKLTLDSSTANTTITGTVNLQGSASELAFIDNDQTIDGTGKIVGQNAAAKITITPGDKLTNDATIEGKLEIADATISGSFVNTGTVHANVAGTLEISTDTFDDDSTAVWKVSTSSNAVLYFNVDSGSLGILDGDFLIEDNGRLSIDSIGFVTFGSLDWTGGVISLADGSIATFGFRP